MLTPPTWVILAAGQNQTSQPASHARALQSSPSQSSTKRSSCGPISPSASRRVARLGTVPHGLLGVVSPAVPPRAALSSAATPADLPPEQGLAQGREVAGGRLLLAVGVMQIGHGE